jgi:hypothetical protein
MASMIKSTIVRRRLVLALALICLWISSVGTAHHDANDLANVRAFIVHQSTLHQATPDSGPDYCVACAWEQGLASGHTPYVVAPVTPEFNLAPSLMVAESPLHVRTITHSSPRAPPALNG